MARIIMQKPDGTHYSHPEDIFIKRNGQSEALYRMLEEEKHKILSENEEPKRIITI